MQRERERLAGTVATDYNGTEKEWLWETEGALPNFLIWIFFLVCIRGVSVLSMARDAYGPISLHYTIFSVDQESMCLIFPHTANDFVGTKRSRFGLMRTHVSFGWCWCWWCMYIYIYIYVGNALREKPPWQFTCSNMLTYVFCRWSEQVCKGFSLVWSSMKIGLWNLDY